MVIIVDLEGLKTKEDILKKFGEVFGFKVDGMRAPEWGMNWDALLDCLRKLDNTSQKTFTYPGAAQKEE